MLEASYFLCRRKKNWGVAMKKISIALSVILAVTPFLDAHAGRLGFGRILRAPLHGVYVIPKRAIVLPYRSLRRTLGVIAVASVGVVILSGLTVRQRAEVGRRTTTVVEGDPDKEITDTYELNKSGKVVKITATRALPPDDWRDDPTLKVADTATTSQTGGTVKKAEKDVSDDDDEKAISSVNEPAAEKDTKSVARQDSDGKDTEEQLVEHVKLGDVPSNSNCRKVITELKTPAKNGAEGGEKVEANSAIVCRMADGKWQPVVL